MRVLVTGAAGFIGFHLCERLLNEGHSVVALDNINDYYSRELKFDRLHELGLTKEDVSIYKSAAYSSKWKELVFYKLDLQDRGFLPEIFKGYNFDLVCNLAAQAGVRYSIENPQAYIDSNVVGFSNILECCRRFSVKSFVYASSSSVYGLNKKIPFETEDRVDEPISLYAATKRSNELMAYTYSHLYNIKTTGLRFFTVYGPWGRPDMAMYLFTKGIIKGEPIMVFNEGKLARDFTYIADIIEGVSAVINDKEIEKNPDYRIFNLGNGEPVKLLDFINEIEIQLGKSTKKIMLPMQSGDVEKTWADCRAIRDVYNFNSKYNLVQGVELYLKWFKNYKLNKDV
jgi:UDP-glucuronate 4-epimerase